MKSVKHTTDKGRRNWALPNQSVSHEEFMVSIRKAEEGPFMSIDEFKDRFNKWKNEKYPL